MKALENILFFFGFFGIAGLAGAAESGQWVVPIILTLVCGTGIYLIEKGWHFEEDHKHTADRSTCPRPKYLH